MLKLIAITCAALLGVALAHGASAQAKAGAALPPDVDPISRSRLPALTRADLDAEGQAIYDRIIGDDPPPKTGPRAVTLHSPKIAEGFAVINDYLRYNGALSPRHTEVAILVAAWEIEQAYEWTSHEPAALRYGAPQAVIDTIKYDRAPVNLSPEETLIIKFGRQLLRDHKLDSALYAEAVEMFGRKGVLELATVMGDYVMAGIVLTAVDQHSPEGVTSLLPAR